MAAPVYSRPVPKRVGLFVTCLVDMIRPSIGFAAVKLLEDAGCTVEVPRQSCCGQPAFNSGDRATAEAIARQVIVAFGSFDYVVAPSGSCAGMIKVHFPELFHGDPNWQPHADALAEKTYELTSFLVDVCGLDKVAARLDATATYHDSCSGLRELGVRDQPRRLLASVRGLRLTEMPDANVCCGFGGTFCVKYPDISNAIVAKKTAAVAATGADLLLAGDLGCLMNMAGKLQRDGAAVEVRHVAEVLAGMTDAPAIGAPRQAPPERRRPAAVDRATPSAHLVTFGADGGETPPLQEGAQASGTVTR
jgi:L-lactate dehydrogenase complex protein LldE